VAIRQARLPPQAAPTEGRPKIAAAAMDQSREAHHSARPHSPEGAMGHGPLSMGAPGLTLHLSPGHLCGQSGLYLAGQVS
jgi:hypothetical protein